MKVKHFAIFSAQFLPNIGGVEKYTDNLARELARQGNAVTVVTTDVSAPSGVDESVNGIKVVRLPSFPALGGRMPIPRKNSNFKRLWEIVESQSYDGVLVNTRFYLHSLLGLSLAKKQGLRAVVCEHGSAYLAFNNVLINKAVVAYEHVITAQIKRYDPDFYAVSRKGTEWLKTFRIQGKGVLSNAINVEAFRSCSSGRSFKKELRVPRGAILASFVGRFVPEKGIDSIIEAMGILETQGVPVMLAMAGAGPLEGRIRDAGLSNVFLLGKLEQPDIAALMIESDIFCLPTRSEGFSTSLLEASACSTPSIITDVGGVAEMIPDSSYGTVIADMKSTTIAEALKWAANNTESLEKQGSQCRERVTELYSWECTAKAVVQALGDANR